jgi:hypothetical protein
MSQDDDYSQNRDKVNHALGSRAAQIPSGLDDSQYSIRASAAVVRLIAKEADILIGNDSEEDDDFVAGIFAFVVSNHITYLLGAPFEIVATIVVIDLLGQQAASEVPTLMNSFNRMAQEGRVIEAIGQNVAKWISTPTDERFDKLVALYKLCREHV